MSAIKQESSGSPYRVPPEPKRWPAIGLAVGVHALLLAFLYIGVSWQTTSPVTVEAEVWDMKTEMAAPPPPPPTPEPEPESEPETPPPQPAPRAVEPPPPPVAKVEPKAPDIALEQKKRKEELKRKEAQAEADRLERERERERELAEQKRADDKKAKALADKKERELAEKKERELAEKKAADKKAQELAKKEEAEKKKADKEKADKLAKAKAEKAEAAQLAKLASMSRADETKRLTAGNGSPGSTGSAEKSTAPRLDAGYSAKIAALIKSNTSYAGSTDVPGNPMVSFRVEQLPTGEIVSVKKVKSSGIPEFDDAVERGIKKTETLPKKKDGTVERSLSVDFKLKEMK